MNRTTILIAFFMVILAAFAFYTTPWSSADAKEISKFNYNSDGSKNDDAVEEVTEADEVAEVDNPLIYEGETHFANMRQMTFEGENAEAYWSADGTRLIFQRHIEEDGCDQIYIMDFESGEFELVSAGTGVTTCSYFQYPNDDKIIYCSTHLTNEECPEKLGGGYVWSLWPEFEVLRADLDGSNIEQLTNDSSYDAEATYAHDGSRIIYTSLASGDLELWTMLPDGGDKIMLTDRLGYDGGAFYSWDSTKIVWRAYYPESEPEIALYNEMIAANAIAPMALQVWTMDADGSNKFQVTDNNGANFCPFYQPGDERIIFATNAYSMSPMDFNLWIVDVDGTNLEEVTTFDGFDAFPMFSPDGTMLAFGSNRNQANPGDTNIFVAEWVD